MVKECPNSCCKLVLSCHYCALTLRTHIVLRKSSAVSNIVAGVILINKVLSFEVLPAFNFYNATIMSSAYLRHAYPKLMKFETVTGGRDK